MKITRSSLFPILGGILVIAGLVVIGAAAQMRNANVQTQAQPAITAENGTPKTVAEQKAIQGNPIELSIPSLGLQEAIIPGVFDNRTGQWTLTLDKVQYATMTYQPNDKQGLTFMYGHNRREVFSLLPGIKEDAIAAVKTDNNHTFYYRFKSSKVTAPEDISIFAYDGPPLLVLQTCTGVFYQNRQLFSFEFIGVDGHA